MTMEFTPEIAVLECAFKFAQTKVKCELHTNDPAEIEQLLELVCPAIQEILDGLEGNRSQADVEFWNFRIFSFLFLQILKLELDEETVATTSHGQIESGKCSNTDSLFHHIPRPSFVMLLELIKKFEWQDNFLQCLQSISKFRALSMVQTTLVTMSKCPADIGTLRLIVTCQKYLSWILVSSATNACSEECDLACSWGLISKWLAGNASSVAESLSDMFPVEFGQLINSLTVQVCVHLSNSSDEDLRQLFLSCQSSALNFENETTQIILSSLNMSLRQSTRSQWCNEANVFAKFLTDSRDSFPELVLIDVLVGMCKSASETQLQQELSRGTTLSLGVMDVNMENMHRVVLQTFKDKESQCTGNENLHLLSHFWSCIVSDIDHQKILKTEAEEASRRALKPEDILCERLDGWEECLEKIVQCDDIDIWKSERHADILSRNTNLLFREGSVCSLHRSLKKMVKTGGSRQTLQQILKIVLGSFTRLPIMTQEKIILDNLCSGNDANSLADIGHFHQDMNTTFNKFTSESSEKDLQSVLRLLLLDPVTVIRKAVDTAIKNPGQISVVLKVFDSVPEVCRCQCGQRGPSLLCDVIAQHLLATRLDHNQQKNVIKLVIIAVQSFSREVCGQRIMEPAILTPSEVASTVILPFIGSSQSHAEKQPISIEFALKLLICLMERKKDKDYGWLVGLQPQALILCLYEVLQDCLELWDVDNPDLNKANIKQICLRCLQIIQANSRAIFSNLNAKAIDWLKQKMKSFDWLLLLHLHRLLSKLDTLQAEEYQKLLNLLTSRAVDTCGLNCQLMIRLASLSDDTAAVVSEQLGSITTPVSADQVLSVLSQILPNFLLSEWTRVVGCLSRLISQDLLPVQYRVLFSKKINLSFQTSVKCLLTLTQILTDVAMTISRNQSLPSAAVKHVATCYVTILKEEIKRIQDVQDNDTLAFMQVQIFSHVTVAMTVLEADQSESLFVFLLDIIGRYVDLHKGQKMKMETGLSDHDSAFLDSISLLEDNHQQDSLMKKLMDRK